MKKIVSLLLISLYLLANTGVVVSSHVCGSATTKLFYLNKEKQSCVCGKVKMPKGCCKKTKQTISAGYDQQIAQYSNFDFDHSSFILSDVFVPNFFNNNAAPIANANAVAVRLARPPSVPIYLMIQSFLI